MANESLIIQQIIDDFRSNWDTGFAPKIVDAIATLKEPARSKALALIVPIDIEYRTRTGQIVSASYYREFCETAESIAKEFLSNTNGLTTVFLRRNPTI